MRLRKLLLGAVSGCFILLSGVSVYAEGEQPDSMLTVDFEGADLNKEDKGIMSGNILNNGAEIYNYKGNDVLRLGSVDSQNKCGVEIRNGFAGHYELRQTLTQALENTGITYNGTQEDMDQNDQIQYIEGRTYPYPTYTNGLTMNFWVRMPKLVRENSVLFAFTRIDENSGNGGLYMTAGGTLRFWEGDVEQEIVRNNFCTMFSYIDMPVAMSGEWVNVSVVIENDWVSVYINGELKYNYMEDEYGYGFTKSRNFNKGFGTRGEHEAIIEYRGVEEAYKNYRDLLVGFSDEEKAAGDFSDYSKYTFLNSDGELLVDFITDENTKLYVGGDDGSSIWAMAEYNNNSKNILYDDFKFYNFAADDEKALEIYNSASAHEDNFIDGIDPEKEKRYYPADMDGNKKIELQDVGDVLKVSLKLEEAGEYGNGDLDFDGKVTLDDVSRTLKIALKLEDYYPYKELFKKKLNMDLKELNLINSTREDGYELKEYEDSEGNVYYYENNFKIGNSLIYNDKKTKESAIYIDTVEDEFTEEKCKKIADEYLSVLDNPEKYTFQYIDMDANMSEEMPMCQAVYSLKIGEYHTQYGVSIVFDADGYFYAVRVVNFKDGLIDEKQLRPKEEVIAESEGMIDEEIEQIKKQFEEQTDGEPFEIKNVKYEEVLINVDNQKNIVYYVIYSYDLVYEGQTSQLELRLVI